MRIRANQCRHRLKHVILRFPIVNFNRIFGKRWNFFDFCLTIPIDAMLKGNFLSWNGRNRKHSLLEGALLKFLWMMLAVGILITSAANAADVEIDALRQQEPSLYALYTQYLSYAPGLSRYANQQGFRGRYENIATVVHEEIHIASAVHQGYFIEGTYYEPYLQSQKWPSLRNKDLTPFIRNSERSVISDVYLRSTGSNGLGSILDEMNAYTHVMPFVCRNEPSAVAKQITNLRGFLFILEVYLRTVRTTAPAEYSVLVHDRESAGAIETLTVRAWNVLTACGQSEASVKLGEAVAFIDNQRETSRDSKKHSHWSEF